jgi:deoxyxylulose-5-phosphate synthase
VALFGLGNMHRVAEQAAVQLTAEGFDCAVINPRFTKPLDAGTTEFFARAAELVVTLEDHVLPGGYGAQRAGIVERKTHHDAGGTDRLAGPIHRARHDRGLPAPKIRA